MIEAPSGYEQIQESFHAELQRDAVLFNEFHALIVRAGKEYCKPKPACDGCPLETLPHKLDSELF